MDERESDATVRVLRALGHPLRFAIVQLLADPAHPDADDPCASCEVVCASRLRFFFGVSAPDLTHHMNLLEDVGLVDVHRDGVWVRYELRGPAVARLRSTLADLEHSASGGTGGPDAHSRDAAPS